MANARRGSAPNCVVAYLATSSLASPSNSRRERCKYPISTEQIAVDRKAAPTLKTVRFPGPANVQTKYSSVEKADGPAADL